MLKSVLLASVAAIGLAGVANASDLPVKNAPATPVHMSKKNPFDGFYIGVHGGYGMGDTTIDYSNGQLGLILTDSEGIGFPPIFDTFDDGSFKMNHSGYLLGTQAGANFVSSSGLFIGGELSGSWAGLNVHEGLADDWSAGDYEGNAGGIYDVNYRSNIDAIGVAKAKLGWASDTIAIYASAGVALAHQNTSFSYSIVGGYDSVGPSGNVYLNNTQNRSAVLSGFAFGGGADLALTNNVTLGVSYDYIKFNGHDENYFDVGPTESSYFGPYSVSANTIAGVDTKSTTDLQIVKVNLNYHF